jgi:hypothetical protein
MLGNNDTDFNKKKKKEKKKKKREKAAEENRMSIDERVKAITERTRASTGSDQNRCLYGLARHGFFSPQCANICIACPLICCCHCRWQK